MIKRWYSSPTPFVILSVIVIIILLYGLIAEREGTEGWRYLAIHTLLPALILMIVIDLLLKWTIRKATKWIWLIEAILILGFVYWWVVT
jgi:hypothetical protein